MGGNEPMSSRNLADDNLGIAPGTPAQAWTPPVPTVNAPPVSVASPGSRFVPLSPVSPDDLSWDDPADASPSVAPRRALPPDPEPPEGAQDGAQGLGETSMPLRGGLLPVKPSRAMDRGWVPVKAPKPVEEGEGFTFPTPIGHRSRGLSSNSPARAYEDKLPTDRFQPRWLWVSATALVAVIVVVAVVFALLPKASHPAVIATPAPQPTQSTAPVTPAVTPPASTVPSTTGTPSATGTPSTAPGGSYPATTRKVLQDLVKNPDKHIGESFKVYGYISFVSDNGMKIVTWVGPEKSKATTQYKANLDHPYLVAAITETPSKLKVNDLFSADAVVGNPVQGNGKKFALLQLQNVVAYGSAK